NLHNTPDCGEGKECLSTDLTVSEKIEESEPHWAQFSSSAPVHGMVLPQSTSRDIHVTCSTDGWRKSPLMITTLLGTGGEDADYFITCIENKMQVPSSTWQLQEKFKQQGEQMTGLFLENMPKATPHKRMQVYVLQKQAEEEWLVEQ
ncbi:hypothetical protein U0070_012939, partial [Myodes glareolus]